MGCRTQTKLWMAPEVAALADYMRKKGLEPDGAEAWLVSHSLRWFMGELGINNKGAIARAIRTAFVNQALLILLDYDHIRAKFAAMKPDAETEVSSNENR